jgi:ubiquinone biosynthesis protein UbiJ
MFYVDKENFIIRDKASHDKAVSNGLKVADVSGFEVMGQAEAFAYLPQRKPKSTTDSLHEKTSEIYTLESSITPRNLRMATLGDKLQSVEDAIAILRVELTSLSED